MGRICWPSYLEEEKPLLGGGRPRSGPEGSGASAA